MPPCLCSMHPSFHSMLNGLYSASLTTMAVRVQVKQTQLLQNQSLWKRDGERTLINKSEDSVVLTTTASEPHFVCCTRDQHLEGRQNGGHSHRPAELSPAHERDNLTHRSQEIFIPTYVVYTCMEHSITVTATMASCSNTSLWHISRAWARVGREETGRGDGANVESLSTSRQLL